MSEFNEIVIVSGLPRSGTSLMMQMLASGGIEPLTDQIRQADTDNPRGYFEFERVKKIKEDKTWFPSARGKAVKMISQLLYELPKTESYKVIFMRRDMDEIIASQERMLQRRGNAIPDRAMIKEALNTHLEKLFSWLQNQEHLDFIQINFNQLVRTPEQLIQPLSHFLPCPLDVEEALKAIDPTLYRNRETTTS